jgi:hypothetical protein
MIYVILFLIWCVAVSISPLFVLFMTGLICLAVFPTSAGRQFRRTGSICNTKSADHMTIDELDRYSKLRKTELACGDWDGTPSYGMKEYYEKELDRIMPNVPEDDDFRREQEELKVIIMQNQAKEDVKLEEKDARRKRFQQIIEKARQNAKIAGKNANKG